jgi:hypothetical protein
MGHRRSAGDGYSPWGIATAWEKEKENPISWQFCKSTIGLFNNLV